MVVHVPVVVGVAVLGGEVGVPVALLLAHPVGQPGPRCPERARVAVGAGATGHGLVVAQRHDVGQARVGAEVAGVDELGTGGAGEVAELVAGPLEERRGLTAP